MALSLRFSGNGVSFPGCLWPIILLVPIFGLTQGPSWWCAHLSAKMDSSVSVSGRLAGHIMGWHLLPPFGPSRILPVSFGDSAMFLIGTSYCEKTHASSYVEFQSTVP